MVENVVARKEDIKRVKTYIEGFDEALQGGIPKGHITLIAGSAGTMKSSVCLNILYNEAVQGRVGLYVSLEQSYASLINHMINMGYDFNKIHLAVIKDLAKMSEQLNKIKTNGTGALILVDLGCIRKEIKEVKIDENRSWLNVIKNIIKKVSQDIRCDLFVIDSLKALYVLSRFKNPRIELFYLFEFLRDVSVTTLLITETPAGSDVYGEYDEDFLSDGIISIRLAPFRRKLVREIRIVKMRTTECNHDIFSLEFKGGSFRALYGGQNPLL